MVRPDRSGVVAIHYGCEDCEFGGDAKNGVGLAAQHAEKHPDHAVWADQVTNMRWNEAAWDSEDD